MRVGQADRQFDQHEGRRGAVPRARRASAAPMAPPSWSWRSTKSARPTRPQRKVEICERAYKLLVADGLPTRGHHLRPQHLRGRDRDRRASPLRARLHRGVPRDPARAAPARPHFRRPLQPQLLVPRQRAGAPRDAQRVPLSRNPRRAGHGHRQRRPARRLRHDRPRAARGLRGRHPRPPRRRDRAAGRHSPSAISGTDAAEEKKLAEWRWLAGRRAAVLRAGQGHRRAYRRGHRGSAASSSPRPDRSHRRPADGRHERRRRPVRIGQDVPAAGGEVGAGDEEARSPTSSPSSRPRRKRPARPRARAGS